MRDDIHVMAFGLGTFHAALLVLLLLVPLFLLADLGSTLEGLGTALGLGVFGGLWAISVYCTYRAMAAVELRPGSTDTPDGLVGEGQRWGAYAGAFFLWVLVLAGFIYFLQRAPMDTLAASVFVGSTVILIGTLFAAPIGAFIGTVFTALDMALLSIARRLVGVRG